MNEKTKVLILEDIPEDAELLEQELKKVIKNYALQVTDNEKGFVAALKTYKPDLILSDYTLPQFNGMEAIKLTKEISPLIPVIIVTGSINEQVAVDCIKAGAIEVVTGYAYEEFQSFNVDEWAEHIHPDDRDRIFNSMDKAMENHTRFDNEYRFQRKDGSYIFAEEHGAFVTISETTPFPIIGSIIDITERKLAENDLKYRSLFDNKLNGLAYCKIVVDENNRPVDYIFLEINRAFEEFAGLKKEVVLGKRITEIIPGFEKSAFDFIGVWGKGEKGKRGQRVRTIIKITD